MTSRKIRWISGAAALLAVGLAVAFLVYTERQIAARRTAFHTFDVQAHEVSGDLAAMRAAQQAYVAAGQGLAFWVPEVAGLIAKTTGSIEAMRASASSTDAASALAEAAARVAEFNEVDARARDYLRGGEQLMAADVVFAEGGETALAARHQMEAARLAEQLAVDTGERASRWFELVALAAAASLSLLVTFLLIPLAETAPAAQTRPEEAPAEAPSVPAAALAVSSKTWTETADLCTDLSRVNNADDLSRLLGRATDLMDASGIVIWLGEVGGSTLRPVMAHGYPAQVVAQMPALPRSADNAAAAAYRTGRFQIVLARPGSSGALVAPLLAPEGCIGALTAEMRDGSEATDRAQALASIVAAQLSGVLASSVGAADEHDESSSRSAAG